MKKNTKIIIAITIGILAVVAFLVAILKTAGGNLDVVGNDSATSFDSILKASGDNVTADEMNGGWSLRAPDDSIRFIWSQDYSKSPIHDVMVEFDAAPFINAGLEISQLPEDFVSYEDVLMVGTKLGKDAFTYKGEPTPLAAYEQIVKNYRSAIGYHTALDHYNVSLGNGNMFEWAKDMQTNSITKEDQDKDIVFVLNPEPLIEAGVDPENVEGWIYTTVNVEIDGKPADVYKFLKPFNLQ